MIAKSREELPAEYGCRLCDATKPIDQMILIRRRRTSDFLLRPRCKACHNAREKGHRRDYKRKYQRAWRKHHPELNESYWRDRQEENRPIAAARARERFKKHHAALLIQGRLRRRLGMSVTLQESTDLCKKYGPAYPTRHGLTPAGLRECERIRSAMRTHGKPLRSIEIRMMVYEDGFHMRPNRQKIPYQRAANQLAKYRAQKKAA